MTKEALKLALEALEEAWYHVGTFQPTEKAIDLYDEARTAIKEALAQPQPWEKFCDSNCVWTDHHPDCKLAERLPLTDEELRKLADKHLFYQPEGYEVSGVFALARAIEVAHGIKD
jgi:hypothetical protein